MNIAMIKTLSEGQQKDLARIVNHVRTESMSFTKQIIEIHGKNSLAILMGAVKMAESIVQECTALQPIACAKGCDFCCHLRVEAMPFEIHGIVNYLYETLDQVDLVSIYRAIKDRAQRAAGLDTESHKNAKIPCAFLENGACSIYKVRPLVCVGYHALDRQECEDGFNGKQQSVLQNSTLFVGAQSVSLGVLEVIDKKQLDKHLSGKPELHATLLPVLRAKLKREFGNAFIAELDE